MTGNHHSVTVVVVTRNRRDELLRTLDRLDALAGRPPITVLDNGSSDGTLEAIYRAHPGVITVALPDNLGAAARNLGAAMARTPYVAFSDDDTWWADDALAMAVQVLDAQPNTAVLTARVLVGPGEREDSACALMAKSPLPRYCQPGIPVIGFLAGAAVVRRDAFLSVGGFPERYLIGGEEELLAIDLAVAGWRLVYLADLVAHLWVPRRSSAWFDLLVRCRERLGMIAGS